MNKILLHSLINLAIIFSFNQVSAQRIGGYFPNYAYTAANNTNMQYQKMTHLYYFSLNPNRTAAGQSDGGLWINDPFFWFTTSYFDVVIAQARLINPNIKIILVTGGAPGSDTDLNQRLTYIATNDSRLNTFCNNICTFIKNNNLDGWDLDWEFPTNATERNGHEAMLAKMREKIDSMKTADCKHYEISIAVGGGYTTCSCWNPCDVTKVNGTVINHVDIINIMSYDGATNSPWDPSCSHSSHQHYDRMVRALNDWKVAFPTWPNSKLTLGVGFYDNPPAQAFRAGGNNSTWYNLNYWGNGGGSGCSNLQSKIDYIRTQGLAGSFIWELTQDNLCTGTVPVCYSLLDCMYQHTLSTWGTWSEPLVCPAPVSLVSFSGSYVNSQIELEWTTANELNNDYFIIKRSLNIKDGFIPIGKVIGNKSTESLTKYSFIDSVIFQENVAYYRLAQYDLDKKVTYSKIISVNKESEVIEVLIGQNPFTEETTLLVKGNQGETLVALLYDYLGNTVIKFILENEKEIKIGGNLKSGVYLLKVNKEKSMVQKLLKY